MAEKKKLTVQDTPNARGEYAYEVWWRGKDRWKFMRYIWMPYSYAAFLSTPQHVWNGMVSVFQRAAVTAIRPPRAGLRWELTTFLQTPDSNRPTLRFDVEEVRDVGPNDWKWRRRARANHFAVQPPMNFLQEYRSTRTSDRVLGSDTFQLYTMPGGVALNQRLYEQWVDPQHPLTPINPFSVEVNDPESPLPDTVAVALDKALEEGLAGIKDIKRGTKRVRHPDVGHDFVDYSHLLLPEVRKKLVLSVAHWVSNMDTDTIAGTLWERLGRRKVVGGVRGRVKQGFLMVEEAWVADEWQGTKSGKALYEAMYREAYALGAREVRGGKHSTQAHHVHNSLQRKHPEWRGYAPKPNTTDNSGDWEPEDWAKTPEKKGHRDDRWQSYQHPLAGTSETVWGFGTAHLYMQGYAPRPVRIGLAMRDGGKRASVYVEGFRGSWGAVTLHGPMQLKKTGATLQLNADELRKAFIHARPAQLGTWEYEQQLGAARMYRPRPPMLDWRDPSSWPATINLAEMSHDFQVLLGDNFGIEGGTFPLVKASIDEVIIPPVDESSYDDRHYNEETGEHDDTYLATLTELMRNGERFPPAVVGNDAGNQGKRYGWPYDGKHRINAAKRLGLTVIPLIDITGYTAA